MADTSRPLTPLQQRFLDEYLVDLNATAAYRRAGYKVRSDAVASVNASRLLANAKIVEALAIRQTARAGRVEITQDYVLTRLRENVERSMQAIEVIDRDGTATGEYQYQGAVANKALELLGKHLGMFPNKHEVSGVGGVPIQATVTHDIAADLAPYASAIADFVGRGGALPSDDHPQPVDPAQA